MSILISNEVQSLSLEELSGIKKYLKEQGLYAYALDLEYIIADRIMDNIDNGDAITQPESSVSAIFAKAKRIVEKRNDADSRI